MDEPEGGGYDDGKHNEQDHELLDLIPDKGTRCHLVESVLLFNDEGGVERKWKIEHGFNDLDEDRENVGLHDVVDVWLVATESECAEKAVHPIPDANIEEEDPEAGLESGIKELMHN